MPHAGVMQQRPMDADAAKDLQAADDGFAGGDQRDPRTGDDRLSVEAVAEGFSTTLDDADRPTVRHRTGP